ncbi:MAG: hypothetical protein WD226_13630 [Planctomycetota bacterium]
MIRRTASFASLLLPLFVGCQSATGDRPAPAATDATDAETARTACPIPGATLRDDLIEPGEEHFQHLWMVTDGGQNAEGYWSFGGDRLVLQRRQRDLGIDCDRIFVTDPVTGALQQLSSGRGATTCAYFLPGDEQVLFASTQAHHTDCPPPVDMSEGYTWMVHPEYDVYVHDLATGSERALTSGWGYDAEATVSPVGDRFVFTSTRSGDLELWTANLDGSDPVQVTDEIGYDGGGFFSHDGRRIVFRTTRFLEDRLDTEHRRYRELLEEWKVRPHSMDIMLIDADGTNRRRVTDLGQASFAPFFFPNDERILFSTNHHDTERKRNFDLFAVDVDGTNLERVTTYDGFDSFPMFSPDGRFVAFASNRGNAKPGETNQFVALWR